MSSIRALAALLIVSFAMAEFETSDGRMTDIEADALADLSRRTTALENEARGTHSAWNSGAIAVGVVVSVGVALLWHGTIFLFSLLRKQKTT